MVSATALTAGILTCLIVLFALAVSVRYSQYSKRVARRQQRLMRADKLLDALAGTLRATANPDAAPATSLNPDTDTLMLVFTDIESSTTAASTHPQSMLVVQEAHDRLMRQGIQRFAGYEIHTQGDAFEVAFATAVSAVQFCLWTQDQLMHYEWSKDVLSVPQFAKVVDEETDDVVFRGPRVRMGVHAAPPGTWRKATHGYTHHTVFGGEGVDLIAVVSDAGHGGQIILTKDAADNLIPRIHKVDALLESIGTFRVTAEETVSTSGSERSNDESAGVATTSDTSDSSITMELFDCQPVPTPKRPRRPFSKKLRRIEYVAPGRSLAVIPPPPSLHKDSADSCFIVVVIAEDGTGDDADLADALADVLAQQAQLAGGYLASPDACAPGGAVVIFRTDYGAAARFLAVLPVVLAWWEWPDTAKKSVVVEGSHAVPTVRVKVAMHVSPDVHEHALTKLQIERMVNARLARGKNKNAHFGASKALQIFEHRIERAGSLMRRGGKLMIDAVDRTGKEAVKLPGRLMGGVGGKNSDTSVDTSTRGGSHGNVHAQNSNGSTTTALVDDLYEFTELTEVRGAGLDACRAVVSAAHPGQCLMTLSAFTMVQSNARMPAGAFPVSLGRHAITQSDLTRYESDTSHDSVYSEELYELVSTFLGMRSKTPRLFTAKALTPGFRQSPDPTKPVAVCFVSLSAPDRDSEVTKKALEQASNCLRKCLTNFRGYECKCPEPNKFTLAFGSFDDAVSFTGALHLNLLKVEWSEELLLKSGCGIRTDSSNPTTVIWKGLHARCGVAYGNGCTRKPLNTGRADYFGAIPNLAARICAVAQYGQTLIEPTEALQNVTWPENNVDQYPYESARYASPTLKSSIPGPSLSPQKVPQKHKGSFNTFTDAAAGTVNRRASLDYQLIGESTSNYDTFESSTASEEYTLLNDIVSGAFQITSSLGTDDGNTNVGDDLSDSNNAMTLDLLGAFDLRGVSRPATLAQAMPVVLRVARSKTFDPPQGLALNGLECEVGVCSIASRDAHLHYDKKGTSFAGFKSTRGFTRSRSITKKDLKKSTTVTEMFRSLFAKAESVGDPVSSENKTARRKTLCRKRDTAVDKNDAALAAAENGTSSTMESSHQMKTPPVSTKSTLPRSLDRFRNAGKKVVVNNRLAGALVKQRLRKGNVDDWGFDGDLENMPTAESERRKDDAAVLTIGSGKGAERLLNFSCDSDAGNNKPPVERVPSTPSLLSKSETATVVSEESIAVTEPAA